MKTIEEHDFRKRHLIFVDLETTGLDKDKHEIIDIGLMVVNGENFEVIEEYAAKIKPTHIETAAAEALQINGYSARKWKEAKDLEETLRKVASVSKDGMIAGWNIGFDWDFIERGFKKFKIRSTFNYHKIDVQAIAYAALYKNKDVKSLRMRDIAAYFGIKLGDVHGAEEDTRVAYELFRKLMEKNA